MVVNNFIYFTFSMTHGVGKVGVFLFLFVTLSSSLGFPIVLKFEEWKRFAQLLVGKSR